MDILLHVAHRLQRVRAEHWAASYLFKALTILVLFVYFDSESVHSYGCKTLCKAVNLSRQVGLILIDIVNYAVLEAFLG